MVILRTTDIGGHRVTVCVAPDDEVGFTASSAATPLWVGYGATVEEVFEGFVGVARAGLSDMAARGIAFAPAG
jgi:hypothetical protein